MKMKNIILAVCLTMTTVVYAQECEMPISIQLDGDYTSDYTQSNGCKQISESDSI